MAEKPKNQIEVKPKEDNQVFVGKKPTMSYVLAVMTQLQAGYKEVFVKARGKSISRAVDVVEVVKNRFIKDIQRNIEIGTEILDDPEGRKINISTISITLKK